MNTWFHRYVAIYLANIYRREIIINMPWPNAYVVVLVVVAITLYNTINPENDSQVVG